MNDLKIGDRINLIAKKHSSYIPELVPSLIESDQFAGGRSSIRYYLQSERIPEENNIYSCYVEDIVATAEMENERIVVYIILSKIQKMLYCSRRNDKHVVNYSFFEARSKYFFYNDFAWRAGTGLEKLGLYHDAK